MPSGISVGIPTNPGAGFAPAQKVIVMINSLYSFGDVEANNPPKNSVRDIVANVLRADGGACYSEMEAYLLPPGVSGSKFFDQAYAVSVLLKHDRDGEGQIAKVMVNTPTLKHRTLWDVLQQVLRTAGFKMSHGRLAGLIENRSDETEKADDGQPDIG